jgi:hypothetical protein
MGLLNKRTKAKLIQWGVVISLGTVAMILGLFAGQHYRFTKWQKAFEISTPQKSSN